jgi:hypothetical protein
MFFSYAKIESLSGKFSQDTLEESQTHAERGRSTMWTRVLDTLQVLRWPTTFVLLFIVIVCEIFILHKQLISLPIGAELNGLVPHCKFLACRSHSVCLMAHCMDTLTSEKSRKSRRYFVQTRDISRTTGL